MYNTYDAIARLNEAALRRCEEHFLDPDYDEYDRYADDEEEADDDPC